VKLLIDMNLPPSWADRLARHGHEAVHWSSIGAVTAPDREILEWAREHGRVLVTHDLDFSAILAATSEQSPSVLQLRALDILSEDAITSVIETIRANHEQIERGALPSIDERGARIRILPLRTRTTWPRRLRAPDGSAFAGAP
jgi:predicted nuclease of predicted toxin-antitoxin system